MKLTVVGHAVIDYISIDGIPIRPTPGGTVTYTSIAASKLGLDVAIISKVGLDFPEDFKRFLENFDVSLTRLRIEDRAYTTSYLIKYTSRGRRMWLRNRCLPITLADLDDLEDTDIVHLGPVACELDKTTVAELLKSGIPISLDVQGMLRKFTGNGYVTLAKNYDLYPLRGFKVIKLSLREAEVIVGSSSVNRMLSKLSGISGIVAVTAGGRGVYVASGSNAFHMPAYRTKIVDPTGGGDCFVAGLIYGYIKGEDLTWSTALGLASASFVVEGYGPSNLGGLNEVYERASLLIDKARRINL
ncbi:MAG: PfkB family carbohydrate kinase [Candidatus Bathyarchaeota archaeon]|nr:PfkB family carbohydrate kinase [Candidatus Bathyarchaeota archaeon]